MKNILYLFMLTVLLGCTKSDSPDHTIILSGAIYSSKDSLPFRNTTFNLFTVKHEFLGATTFDNIKTFTTDSFGHFSESFDAGTYLDVGLKWPYVHSVNGAFYGWSLGIVPVKYDAGIIYTKP